MGNRQAYDEIAEVYAERKVASSRAAWSDSLMDWLVQATPRGGWVLDAGCGHGAELQRLRDMGLRPVGLDLSLGMLRFAARTRARALLQADICRLPFPNAALDAAWSLHALLHVEDLQGALRELGRVLKPGAPVALTVALGDGTTEEPVPYAPAVRRLFVHWQPEQVLAAAASAGLVMDESGQDDQGRTTMWLRARRV